jgi:hypothetical protein
MTRLANAPSASCALGPACQISQSVINFSDKILLRFHPGCIACHSANGDNQMAQSIISNRYCQRDGFPLVQIQGRWHCVAEYVDRCLGQQAVVEVRQEHNTVSYVFENGHTLPLLCCCCGTPLAFADLKQTRLNMRGRRLEAMSWQEAVQDNGQAVIEFVLEFSSKGRLDQGVAIATALQSAVQLRHPATCRQRGLSPLAARVPHKRR